MKRYIPLAIVTILVLIAVIFGAIKLFNRPKSQAAIKTARVVINAQGFQPVSLKIQPGTRVTWQNQDTRPHWVASNPHPEHSGLPGLDAKKPLGPDSEYSYIFTKTGRFSYHDHLNPLTNGQIEVTKN